MALPSAAAELADDQVDELAGHDAWIVGEEACVLLDFGGLSGYAKGT